MRILVVTSLLGALAACGSTAECGPAECGAYCASLGSAEAAVEASPEEVAVEPPAVPAALSGFEGDLLAPLVQDIRGGVRPFDPQGIGICRGQKDCDEFLGTDVGELPEGHYMVKAELRVPNTGAAHTWSIDFATECETTKVTASGSSSTSSNNSRTYEVRYAGEQRGYRLLPLRSIDSPSVGGSMKCSYTITARHPDGDKVYTGSWSTPDKG